MNIPIKSYSKATLVAFLLSFSYFSSISYGLSSDKNQRAIFTGSSGQANLLGHGGAWFRKHIKNFDHDWQWKFKKCHNPVYRDHEYERNGCSNKELQKGKVNICMQLNLHNRTKIKKLCVDQHAANKKLNGKFGDSNYHNDKGVLEYYSPINFYKDNDGDDYGSSSAPVVTDCLPPDGYVEDSGDCNDNDSQINPDAVDGCSAGSGALDGIDNNCDGQIDEGVANLYIDNDGDGFGADDSLVLQCPGDNTVTVGGDCDDSNAAINPNAEDVCGEDRNCDSIAPSTFTAYYDADNDGFGDPNSPISYCGDTLPVNYVMNNSDCDDINSNTNPGLDEVCTDNIDNNCDGQVNEGCSAPPATSGCPCINDYNSTHGDNAFESIMGISDSNQPHEYICVSTAGDYYRYDLRLYKGYNPTPGGIPYPNTTGIVVGTNYSYDGLGFCSITINGSSDPSTTYSLTPEELKVCQDYVYNLVIQSNATFDGGSFNNCTIEAYAP